MRFLGIITIVLLVASVTSYQVSDCTRYTPKWTEINQEFLTCDIQTSKTNEPDFLLSSPANNEFGGLQFRLAKDIRRIPANIAAQFSNLKAIAVSDCSVEIIYDSSFKGLRKLLYLNLNDIGIKTIEKQAFADLSGLEYLYLMKNNIQSVSAQLFSSLSNLKKLYLHFNEIEVLHPRVFHFLRHLVELNIGENPIQSLPSSVFETLIEVTKIAMGNNKLETIDHNLLKNNRKLEMVWLDRNNIKSLSPQIFDGKPNLRYIDLRNNSCIDGYYLSPFDGLQAKLKGKLICRPAIDQFSSCEAKLESITEKIAAYEQSLAELNALVENALQKSQ